MSSPKLSLSRLLEAARKGLSCLEVTRVDADRELLSWDDLKTKNRISELKITTLQLHKILKSKCKLPTTCFKE